MAYWRNAKARRLVKEAIAKMEYAEHLRGRIATESLSVARNALALLRDPAVNRAGAVELTAIIHLTILVEELAGQLGEPGATREDLVDALSTLKRMAEQMDADPGFARAAPPGWRELQAFWIPRLEARVATT